MSVSALPGKNRTSEMCIEKRSENFIPSDPWSPTAVTLIRLFRMFAVSRNSKSVWCSLGMLMNSRSIWLTLDWSVAEHYQYSCRGLIFRTSVVSCCTTGQLDQNLIILLQVTVSKWLYLCFFCVGLIDFVVNFCRPYQCSWLPEGSFLKWPMMCRAGLTHSFDAQLCLLFMWTHDILCCFIPILHLHLQFTALY